jgi:hypothetical protein
LLTVPDVRSHLHEVLGTEGWTRLPGRDNESTVDRVGEHVVKIRPATPFAAVHLARAFADVHRALAADRLAPALELACYDGEHLATVHSRVPATAGRADPTAVGAALARCHRLLGGVPVRAGSPWIGFYGEYAEFAALVPAVDDEEIRVLGAALLPHARRSGASGPPQYVHRDLHPGNVLAGPDGVCFVDWELIHAGSALDDLAMTALMWAAESDDAPWRTVGRILAGYAAGGGAQYRPGDAGLTAALALAGLRQGVGGWFTDEGLCTAPYWPYLRKRLRTAAALLAPPNRGEGNETD